jgi:hypothetical protein
MHPKVDFGAFIYQISILRNFIMSTVQKINKNSSNSNHASLHEEPPSSDAVQMDPTLHLVKKLTDKGEYARALDVLSKYTTNPETLNSRGVCLLRMHKFAEAIGPFRMAALNMGSMQVHEHIASHIKINFAIALFFGGFPAGGLDTLSEFKHSENDPGVSMLRKQAELWEQSMSPWRRFYWRVTRIAPAKAPPTPKDPIGRFVWDLKENES